MTSLAISRHFGHMRLWSDQAEFDQPEVGEFGAFGFNRMHRQRAFGHALRWGGAGLWLLRREPVLTLMPAAISIR